jgi:hypothetical protein
MSKTNPVDGLSKFEGRDVLQATIKVTNAGDGLSEALGIEPAEMHLGEKVYLVIEAEVSKVNYEELKDTGTLRRVHTLRAGTATIVEPEFAVEVIEQQRAAIEKARGIIRLDFEGAAAEAFGDEIEDDE